MHLLNAETRELEYFIGSKIPPYAILSHTWGEDEVSFQDLQNDPDVELKAGYTKIRHTCAQAILDGLKYAWVDTCCIDVRSSAELSEAISSMFEWYARSALCYVFLEDVLITPEERNSGTGRATTVPYRPFPNDVARIWETLITSKAQEDEALRKMNKYISPQALTEFRNARWFRRGWTLQELIAPKLVIFFDRAWIILGHRGGELQRDIARVTGIDTEVLRNTQLEERKIILDATSIARRMSWMAKRRTTRKEDEAYCLLGLFDVNMPLLYGEGHKAFERLQKEILQSTPDASIFAWEFPRKEPAPIRNGRLLAPSPECFSECGGVWPYRDFDGGTVHGFTNIGLRISLPLLRAPDTETPWLRDFAILGCVRGGRVLALRLNLDKQFSIEPGQLPVYQPLSTVRVYSRTTMELEGLGLLPTRLRHMNSRTTRQAKTTEMIIRYERSWEVVHFPSPTTDWETRDSKHPGVWLRIADASTASEVYLHSPVPKHHWDVRRFAKRKGQHKDDDFDRHGRLQYDPEGGITCATIDLTYRTCTWRIKMDIPNLETTSAQGLPFLVARHIGPCEIEHDQVQGHCGVQWIPRCREKKSSELEHRDGTEEHWLQGVPRLESPPSCQYRSGSENVKIHRLKALCDLSHDLDIQDQYTPAPPLPLDKSWELRFSFCQDDIWQSVYKCNPIIEICLTKRAEDDHQGNGDKVQSRDSGRSSRMTPGRKTRSSRL